MNWKEQAIEKINSIRQRIGHPLVCELCGGTNWSLGEVVNMSVQKELSPNMVIGGEMMPVSPLVCSMCGNTKFLNLITLGVVRAAVVDSQLKDILDKAGGK